MEAKNNLRSIVDLVLLLIGGIIVYYYWAHNSFETVSNVSKYIMILALAYVIGQILKRRFSFERNWYDWLYYIGLLSIILPPYFVTKENFHTYELWVDLGTLFLVIPILIDFSKLTKKYK